MRYFLSPDLQDWPEKCRPYSQANNRHLLMGGKMRNRLFTSAFIALLWASSASAVPLGLAHHWKADGNTDDSIGGIAGTLVDSTDPYGTGVHGQAFKFDGTNDLFTASVDISPSASPEITFGAWFNIDSISNNRGWAIGHDNGGYDRAIVLHDNRFSGKPSAGTGSTYNSTLDGMIFDAWRFIAVSYNQVTSSAIIYSNGQSQAITTSLGDGLSQFTVGGLQNWGGHQISGLVDDIFIYNRTLSVAEMSDIERNGLVPEPAILALFGAGLTGLGFTRRRKHQL